MMTAMEYLGVFWVAALGRALLVLVILCFLLTIPLLSASLLECLKNSYSILKRKEICLYPLFCNYMLCVKNYMF